jgi:hypothetical protein
MQAPTRLFRSQRLQSSPYAQSAIRRPPTTVFVAFTLAVTEQVLDRRQRSALFSMTLAIAWRKSSGLGGPTTASFGWAHPGRARRTRWDCARDSDQTRASATPSAGPNGECTRVGAWRATEHANYQSRLVCLRLNDRRERKQKGADSREYPAGFLQGYFLGIGRPHLPATVTGSGTSA